MGLWDRFDEVATLKTHRRWLVDRACGHTTPGPNQARTRRSAQPSCAGVKSSLLLTGTTGWQPIRRRSTPGRSSCQWFAGNARAAMDASVHRNEKVHYGNQLHGRAACVISATTRKTMVPLSPMSIMSCLISGN
jgi:hypothetical protein